MLHTVLFCVEPAYVCDCIVVYMDLETSSLDILSGKIVEIGALIEGSHSTFSTVVNPGQDDSIEQPSVHGIPYEELLLGPCHFKLKPSISNRNRAFQIETEHFKLKPSISN